MPISSQEAARMLPANMNTLENRQALMDAGVHARSLSYGLESIGRTNPALLTPERLQALLAAGADAQSICYGVSAVWKANPALNTQENFRALIAAGKNAELVGYGISDLRKANPALATQEIFQALLTAGRNANHVGSGFAAIWRANPALATSQNLQELIGVGGYADSVGNCLSIIGRVNSTLVTQQNFQALIRTNSQMVYFALIALERANPMLITQENIQALLAARPDAVGTIASGISELAKADRALATQVNFDELLRQGANALNHALQIIRLAPSNDRQRTLMELGIAGDDRANHLLDPIYLEAIAVPYVLDGDASRTFFEYKTLIELEREGRGVINHPATREKFTLQDIKDATTIYKKAFDKVVKTAKDDQKIKESEPESKEVTQEEMRAARIKRFKPGGSSGDE